MAEPKTQKNAASVPEFLASIEDPEKRRDCRRVATLMRRATGARPAMWGASIVGFGSYRYRYESGREGEWFLTGFSPRKQALTLYIMPGFKRYEELLSRLGKYKTGKSCLYLKRLADVDEDALAQLIDASVAEMRRKHAAR